MNVQRLKQSCLAQKSPDLKDGVILELIEILEAAEAKLSELEKQQAVGVARMEMAIGKEGLRHYQCFVDMRPDLVVAELNTGMELFTRPAPAVNLTELVQGGWIKCSDQMPEKDVEVQVYCADKKEQMVGYLEENEEEGYFRFANWKNGKGIYCQPTHWKPLAAAPEVD